MNFNDYNDVKAWIGAHSEGELRSKVAQGILSGKALHVARAYLDEQDRSVEQLAPSHDDEVNLWKWRPWRIVVLAAFFVLPALIVCLIRVLR